MKYSLSNYPLRCYMTQSSWYKGANFSIPKGVLWHSTGANNPNLKRYVQPDDNADNRLELLNKIGINQYNNDWNHIKISSGVHAFIGKLANGEITSVQVGEWHKQAWGCGSGKNGSCNNSWIQFEICEDDLTDKDYFNAVYKEAIELTAYLCKLYNFDPKGTVIYNNIEVPVILCHQDSYRLGLGSNHKDVYHWFNKYGKTMEDVRNDVYNLLNPKPVIEPVNSDINITLSTLKKGSSGDQVKALQYILIGKKYDLGKWGADGDYGSATISAVKLFQKDNNLTTDGICGKQTWVKLLGGK